MVLTSVDGLHGVRLRGYYCAVTVGGGIRGTEQRWKDNEKKSQQRWVLLCHKAVNNVLGLIGVLVSLQRQKASQLKKDVWKNDAWWHWGGTQRVSHRFHVKGKHHMLHVWRHLVLGGPGSVLDEITNTLAVVTHPVEQRWRVYLLLLRLIEKTKPKTKQNNAGVRWYSQTTGLAR